MLINKPFRCWHLIITSANDDNNEISLFTYYIWKSRKLDNDNCEWGRRNSYAFLWKYKMVLPFSIVICYYLNWYTYTPLLSIYLQLKILQKDKYFMCFQCHTSVFFRSIWGLFNYLGKCTFVLLIICYSLGTEFS